jgi:fluoride exporter
MNASSSFLTQSLLVAVGGALGAWLRFAVGRLIAPGSFPWATLLVNAAGCFAMGLLVGWLARQGADSEGWRLLLGVGMLGGFTTFSAFSLEVVSLIQRGAVAQATSYVLVSVLAGVAGLMLGLALMRSMS